MDNPRIEVRHVLVAADQLSDDHVRRLAAVADGWASIERIPQETPVAEFEAKLGGADVLVGWASPELLARSRLKAYLCGSAGVDGYFGRGLEAKTDMLFTNAAGTMAVPIAEHVLALMFGLARQLPEIIRNQAKEHWERRWLAEELDGTSVCIVGLGGSGTELAKRCQSLGMKVRGVRRDASQGHPYAETVFPTSRLKEAVAGADRVAVLVPGGPATRHLIGKDVVAAMKRGACYFTASRGSVTDEAALTQSLQSGHLGGAGLDVFEKEPLPLGSPLWSMPNVIVSPHSAGLSDRLATRLCELMCENLLRLKEGRPLKNRIDLAALSSASK